MKFERKIEIWTSEPSSDKKAALPALGSARVHVSQIDISVLSENLLNTLGDFQQMIEKIPEAKASYRLDEIELNLGVSAKGGIALIGKLEAGVQAGIKIKFKRG